MPPPSETFGNRLCIRPSESLCQMRNFWRTQRPRFQEFRANRRGKKSILLTTRLSIRAKKGTYAFMQEIINRIENKTSKS